MNTSIFYMTSTFLALSGLWLLWEFGVRPLMLDNFRDSLFELRDRLYRLSQDGEIQCDSRAYRTVELFLNGTIRYAHRFTLSTFILGQMEMDKARSRGEEVDFSKALFTSIEAADSPFAVAELRSIALQVGNLLPRYAAKSSLFFLVLAGFYMVLREFRPVFALAKKKQAVSALEREIYLAAQSDLYASA